MFPDRGQSVSGLKHLTEKVTAVASLTRVRVVVDHTIPTLLQRSTKLKISHWYVDQCLYTPLRLHLPSKTCWASCFYVFFHSHQFNDMFIVNRRNFVKMFDADKTRMIELSYDEKNYGNMLSHFHLIPERHGRTDRQINIARQHTRRAIKIHTMGRWDICDKTHSLSIIRFGTEQEVKVIWQKAPHGGPFPG